MIRNSTTTLLVASTMALVLSGCGAKALLGGSSTKATTSARPGRTLDIDGLSAAEKDAIFKVEDDFDARHRPALNEACGAEIEVTIDWATYVGTFVDKFSPSKAQRHCENAVTWTRTKCGKDTMRPLIAEKIQTIRCFHDASLEDAHLSLEGGVFSVSANANTTKKAKVANFLGDNL